MKVEIEHLPRIAVITVTGGLVGEDIEDLVSNVKQVLEQGIRLLIIDLRDSGNIENGGFLSILRASAEVKNQSGRVVTVMPRSSFDLEPVITYPSPPPVEVYRSREEAIDALLDLSVVPDRIELEARRICENIESRRRKATGCLILAFVVFWTGAAMIFVALVM